MKTIEEKAKAYDKALEKAEKALEVCGTDKCETARQIFSLFPELKESEDGENKRISKEITQFLKQNNEWNREWLAWLEKQKTMDKEIIFRPLVGTDIRIAAKQALEKIEIGKEVVLAFNGAYIPVNGKTVGEICNEYDAWLEKQDEKKDNNKLIWKHWSTGIAGNGDGKPIYLIKTGNIYSLSSCLSFECDYIELSELDNLMLEKQGEQKPKDRYTFKSIPRLLEMIKPTDRAKAYCQKLINSLIKEGYVIDAMIVGECLKQMNGKDVPMAIMDEQKPYGQRQECVDCQFNYAGECKGSCQMKRDEQNPAWSEEDEAKLKSILFHIEDVENKDVIDWFKSLKDRVLPQPKQEWSEEDNQYLCGLIGLIEQSKAEIPITLKGKAADNCIDWLKSLRPKSQWKPSDEQITWLYRAADDASKDSRMKQVLNELLSDLKKLMEK